MDEYLTLNEASEILKIKRPNLYRLAKSGELPIYKQGKKSVIKKSELEEYKAKQLEIRPLYEK
jgi:excisionase family DNA binding protein